MPHNHDNLITIAIHVRLGDVMDCGIGDNDEDEDPRLLHSRYLKCGSGSWSEKHPSPGYIDEALSLINTVLKPNTARVVIVSDARWVNSIRLGPKCSY